MIEFQPFHKIPRLSRNMVVTEKIDGTNACIYIGKPCVACEGGISKDEGFHICTNDFLAGKRSGWITRTDTMTRCDNHGFGAWAYAHEDELRQLGPGLHFGEWWGAGIQRRYGLTEKRFSLFNTDRWQDDAKRPKCCHVVPVLCRWTFDTMKIQGCIDALRASGSVAAPGFMSPEGIVVYHFDSGTYFKKTLEHDEKPKGQVEA